MINHNVQEMKIAIHKIITDEGRGLHNLGLGVRPAIRRIDWGQALVHFPNTTLLLLASMNCRSDTSSRAKNVFIHSPLKRLQMDMFHFQMHPPQ